MSKMVTEMEPSGIRRFFDVASTMDNVISLGVGEPDFDTPWHIREEGIYSLEKGRTFYTSNAGLLPLRKEVCTYLKRRLKPDNLHRLSTFLFLTFMHPPSLLVSHFHMIRMR